MIIRDLPDNARISFLRAYLDSYRWRDVLNSHPDIKDAEVTDEEAFRDGAALRDAMETVYSASLSEYDQDVVQYDAVVERLNAKYGEDFALTSKHSADLGLRGWRIAAFNHVVETVRHDDGTVTETHTDLAQAAADQGEADLAEPRE